MEIRDREIMDRICHPEEEIRRRTVYELLDMDLPQQDMKRFLIQALGDQSWRVRKAAFETIFRLKDPSSLLPSLVEALRNEDNAGLRNSAIEVLTSMGTMTISFLKSYLKDRDKDLRKFTVEIIGEIGGEEATEPLLTALKDENENVRLTAIEFLGKTGKREVTGVLLDILKKGDVHSRFSALEALSSIGSPIPLEEVYKASKDRILRKPAFDLLKKVGGIDSLSYLLKGLRDRSRTNREAAMTALLNIIPTLPLDEVKGLLKKELTTIPIEEIVSFFESPRIEVKKGAVFLLRFYQQSSAAISCLITALSDKEIEVEVLETIKSLGKGTIPSLLKAYPSRDDRIRSLICKVIGEIGDNKVEAMLVDALKDSYGHVRGSAAIALGKLGTRKSIKHIIPLLQDVYENIQEEAIEALTLLSKRYRPDILPLLSDILSSPLPSLRRRGVTLLGRIGGEDVLNNISLLIKDEDPEVRIAAISAIAEIKEGRYLHNLFTTLTDEDTRVRITAVKALGLFKGKDVVDSLILSLGDKDLWVRYHAIESLGLQGDSRGISALKEFLRSKETLLSIKAIETLKTLLGIKALPLFLDILGHKDTEVKKSAVAALEYPGNRDIASRIIHLLGDKDWSVRKTVVQTLGKIGDASVIDSLKRYFDKERDPLVKESMEKIIEVLKNK